MGIAFITMVTCIYTINEKMKFVLPFDNLDMRVKLAFHA